MGLKSIALLALALGSASPVLADDAPKTNKLGALYLYSSCADLRDGAVFTTFQGGICLATIREAFGWFSSDKVKDEYRFCPPNDVQVSTLIDVTLDYADHHLSQLDQELGSLARQAFLEKWKCQKP